MAGVVSVPANEGISVKNEHDDPEINAMALKMKENFQKVISGTRQSGLIPANNVYINRAGRAVALTTPSVIPSNLSTKESNDKSKDSEDIESVRSRFGWKLIGGCNVPFIIRRINNESSYYVSVRIAESQLLSNYLNYLHANIYTCTSVRSHFITEPEAKLLNEINMKHSDQIYGKELFQAGKDYIVRMEDVQEFYTFIEICYKKLLCNITPGRNEKCGFIRINSESVVPYCIKDDQKYVPLFYFEGETENLKHRAVKLENWNLAYLKFCCKVQGIRNELFASDSCIVTSLDDIKNYFPPDTNFEEYWPAKVVDTQLLTNQKSTHVNPSGAWIRAPPTAMNKLPTQENILSHSLSTPVPPVVPPPSMPLTNNTYQNGWSANQMVNSYSAQAQPPSTRGYPSVSRNPNVAAQYYNSGPAILQQNTGSMNSVSHVLPPPLIRVCSSTTSVVSNCIFSNPVSYSNVPINQPMTTMYSPMTNNNIMSHSNQLRQFYSGQCSNSGGVHSQQQILQQQQQQQLQQQIITVSQTQQPYGSQSMALNGSNARITNTQQRNALRNIAHVITTSDPEIIDLSSPPSSPTPQASPLETVHNNLGWELKGIPERSWVQDSSNNAAYKIQKANIQGKTIYCVNAKPYIYSELMVTIDELVKTMLPSCSIARCAHILNKYLKTTLYKGNSEQLSTLRENGRCGSVISEEIPMAMLTDIIHVFLQLKKLVYKQDEQNLPQFHQTSNPRKRPHMS